MLRYEMKSLTEIFITNDKDFNIMQDRDPSTGDKFSSKEEAVAWATAYALEIGQSLIASETKLDTPTEIELLKKELQTQRADNEVLKGCVMELAEIIYS